MKDASPSGDELILASKSPRRKELLARLTPHFSCVTLEVEEWKEHPQGCAELAKHNAEVKALAISKLHQHAWVIGSDTVVSRDNQSLGKPKSKEEAFQIIRSLSGRNHIVYSGVCLVHASKGIQDTFVDASDVRFFDLSDTQIHNYLEQIDSTQFAGGYPIQHVMGSIVAGFNGSYTNIVGLPIEKTQTLLSSHNII